MWIVKKVVLAIQKTELFLENDFQRKQQNATEYDSSQERKEIHNENGIANIA